MEQTKKQINFNFDLLLKILFISSLVGFGIYVVLAIVFACTKSTYIFANTPFSDFAETLSYAVCKNPYTGEYGIRSIYPPLSFLIFYPFTLICWGPLYQYINGTITLANLSANPLYLISYFLFYLINLVIIMLVVAKLSKLKGKQLFYVLTIVFCFGPLLFNFVRANNTLVTFMLALLFFYLNNEDVKWKKELSYVCLAGAICTKIYPAFIIFYLIFKEKGLNKLWSVLKTLAYALILVFLPFVFIEGGFSNISVLLKNVTGFSSGSSGVSPTAWYTNVSLETIIIRFCEALSFVFGGANMDILHSILSKLLRYGLLLIALILPFMSFKSNKNKEFVALAVGTYLLFPGVCNGYCLTLMIIPFIFLLKDWNNMSSKDKIFYTVCYILIANPLFYIYNNFLISALATLTIVVKSIVDIIRDDVRIFKQSKNPALISDNQTTNQEQTTKQKQSA